MDTTIDLTTHYCYSTQLPLPLPLPRVDFHSNKKRPKETIPLIQIFQVIAFFQSGHWASMLREKGFWIRYPVGELGNRCTGRDSLDVDRFDLGVVCKSIFTEL
jgi:hypothetical protein